MEFNPLGDYQFTEFEENEFSDMQLELADCNGDADADEVDIKQEQYIGGHRPFDPAEHGLNPKFQLSKFINLKGRDSKLPQHILSNLLSVIRGTANSTSTHDDFLHPPPPAVRMGIGMDCSVTSLRHGALSLIQTVDFLYAVVDDPYLMGRIACSNMLNDLYAIGISTCDTIQMLLAIPCNMTDEECDVVIPLLLKGFQDTAKLSGAVVNGGETMCNPWCLIGGAATTICEANQYIAPDGAIVGDVLVLTKPLGIHVAISAYQWLEQPDRWNRIKLIVSEDDIYKSYNRALDSMARLNSLAAKLMHKYNVHGATDVSGYGLLGHARVLAKLQKNEVSFVIHNLPVIAKMSSVAKACGNVFQLFQGTSPEIAGGLLLCLPREQAAAYCKDIENQEGYQAWIIGIVEKGDRSARIIDKPRIIDVPSKERDGELW